MKYEEITGAIIGAAVEVHRFLGPGLLESVYEECLYFELKARNIGYVRQVAVPVVYKGIVLGAEFRIDIIVEEKVAVELKAVERLLPVHSAQIITYMKLQRLSVGLLINFHSESVTGGVKRFAL